MFRDLFCRFRSFERNSVEEVRKTEIEQWVAAVFNELTFEKLFRPEADGGVAVPGQTCEFPQRRAFGVCELWFAFKRVIRFARNLIRLFARLISIWFGNSVDVLEPLFVFI